MIFPDESEAAVPIPDAHEIRERHPKRRAQSTGAELLESLHNDEAAWMKEMIRTIARAYGVDADDLRQEVMLQLIRTDTVETDSRDSTRKWLQQKARWRAGDMLRRQQRQRGGSTTSLDETVFPDPVASEPVGPDRDWTVERLNGLGLSRAQAQSLLLVMWNVDISMHDLAERLEHSYAKVRQDRSRGLQKVRALFDLTPEEETALVAYRRYGGVENAASQLHIDVGDCRQRLLAAEKKIANALGTASNPEIIT